MKVLFAYPPSRPALREDRCQVPRSGLLISPSLPPMDLLSLAAVAEQQGCVCQVSDYSGDPSGRQRFLADLAAFRPGYLVINATTPTLSEDLAACSAAKAALPELKIVAKGAHFLRFHEAVLRMHPSFDMVIRGEAEDALGEILAGRPLSGIAGLSWREGDAVRQNPDRAAAPDLDRLPFPARHLLDNGRYRRLDNGRIQGVIRVSRGCPYHCFFCLATPVSGSAVRMRSPHRIIEEIRHCVKAYGMRDFIFWSDVFSLDRHWVRELCDGIMQAGLSITWSANMRADTVEEATVRAMRRAGCALVSMGVESGNQEMLDRIGKRTTLRQVREAFSTLRKAGMRTLGYFLVGLPWETRETIEETVRFSVALDCDFANFFCAAPLPGTRFFEYALSAGLLRDAAPDGTGFCRDAYAAPTADGHFLTRAELGELHRQAVRRFHLRPRYLLRRLGRIASPGELFSYVRAGCALAWSLRPAPLRGTIP